MFGWVEVERGSTLRLYKLGVKGKKRCIRKPELFLDSRQIFGQTDCTVFFCAQCRQFTPLHYFLTFGFLHREQFWSVLAIITQPHSKARYNLFPSSFTCCQHSNGHQLYSPTHNLEKLQTSLTFLKYVFQESCLFFGGISMEH